MSRYVNVALGQLGPVQQSHSREQVVARLCALMREAHAVGAHLIVFPELALTTFFPRWYIEDEAELHAYFEREMPNAATRPLFELARTLGVGFYLGYAELAHEHDRAVRYNTAIQSPFARPCRVRTLAALSTPREALLHARPRL